MSKPDLDAIQARADSARSYASRVHIQESADDVPALLAYARDLEARVGRVEKLAADWESRGEYDMAYSKTMTDAEAAIQILTNGAQLVDDARLIRAALTPTEGEV